MVVPPFHMMAFVAELARRLGWGWIVGGIDGPWNMLGKAADMWSRPRRGNGAWGGKGLKLGAYISSWLSFNVIEKTHIMHCSPPASYVLLLCSVPSASFGNAAVKARTAGRVAMSGGISGQIKLKPSDVPKKVRIPFSRLYVSHCARRIP